MPTKVNRLSDDIHQRVLGRLPYEPSARALKASEHEHRMHGLEDAIDTNEVVNLPIPKGVGNYKEVLDQAINKYGRNYLDRLEKLQNLEVSLPAVPGRIYGWHRIQHGDSQWLPCDAPSGSTLVLDFETVDINLNADLDTDKTKAPDWRPFLCTAVDENYWYYWAADVNGELPTVATFGNGNLVVGHNVSYDRSYLASEYTYQDSQNRYFDTMAAWIAVRGFTNQQRALVSAAEDVNTPIWVEETTGQSLKAILEFYYPNLSLDKAERDYWVKQGVVYLQQHWVTVQQYAFKDILATLDVFKAVYPELKRSQPHEASWIGQMMLGNTWLPLSDRWDNYYANAEAKTNEVLEAIDKELAEIALKVLENPSDYQKEALDWTPAKTGKNKGQPKWFRDCKGAPSIGSRLAVVLLEVKYLGSVVKWQQETSNTGYYYTDANGKIPHPEKSDKNLSNIFCKAHVKLFEDGVFSAATDDALKLIKDKVSTLNWVSLRKRIEVVHTERPEGYLTTLPQIVVTGTVTRRCADNLWLVASNPKEKRIGTELKSMIEAPEGYSIVGGDVASEELWILSALGDAVLGFNGSTALGLSVLIGDKSQKTDPHSLVAIKQKIERDLAKNIVYGTSYGLGVAGGSDYLRKANLTMTKEQATAAAKELFAQLKGEKSNYDGSFINGMGSHAFNEMAKIATSKVPTTPFLKAKISHCLRGHSDFMTTKGNWTIQSSGSDFRDLLVIYIRFFMDLLKVDGRLALSIHDEFRYIVKDASVKRAVYALQLAHLYTRAFFIDALDLDSLPAAACWLPEVEKDKVLRKNPKDTCQTPSQTATIEPGISYTPQDVLSWFNK